MSNRPDLARANAFLEAYRQRADARLAALLDRSQGELDDKPFGVGRYHALLRDYMLRGGKRLRGALVVLGQQAIVPATDERPFEASLAFELLHAFLLAYDDFMDNDEVRRGGASLHVLAAEEAASRGAADPRHRGVSVTLLLGLWMQSMAFDCLDRAKAGPAARRWFDEVSKGVTLGQLLDVIAVDRHGATLAEVGEIHRLKTGLYTTEGPLVLGALLAGADPDGPRLRGLRQWARPVGEAFQLVDDVLGAVGDPAATGKPAGNDLREGKRSAVLEEAIARLTPAARERLVALAGRIRTEGEAAEAVRLVVESGAPEVILARARGLADRAGRALEGAGLDPEAVETLESLARLVVERHN